MNYIGVESADIAKERVKLRVQKGGHGITDEAIERRYVESLENLKNIIGFCDVLNIYDNTDRFKIVAIFEKGELIWKDRVLPEWIDFI